MADFPANVKLSVIVSGLEKAERKIQNAVSRLEKNKIDFGFSKIDTSNLNRFEKTLGSVTRTAQRAKASLAGLAIGAGFAAGTDALNQLGQALQKAGVSVEVFGKQFNASIPQITGLGDAIRSATGWIEPLDNALRSAGAAGAEWAAAASLATAATVAFGPQLEALGTKFRLIEKSVLAILPRIKDFEVNFNGVERKIRASTDVIGELRESLRIIDRELERTNSQTEEAADMAAVRARVEQRLNNELERQATLLRNAARAQREFNDQAQVRGNVAASRAARAGSGFRKFSEAASVVDNQNAIDKAIRRKRQREEKLGRAAGFGPASAPLMLPSSEMLNAAGRGIKQLSNYYGDLNTKIDMGVVKGREFTQGLIDAAAKGQQLPPIFNQVARSLEIVANRTENASDKKFAAENLQLMRRVDDAEKARQASAKQFEKEKEDRHRRGLARVKEFDKAIADSARKAQEAQRKTLQGISNRLGAGLGGGLIGAGFPALFGASGGEIAGGGIGGVLGGLFGGQGGAFTGSIIGSALGKLVETKSVVKELSEDLGFSVTQTEALGRAFEEAGFKGQKAFKDAITALSSTGLSTDDQVTAIRASSELAKQYGGNIEKIARSIATVFNEGEVKLSSLNKLQSQGIPIQQQLAEKLGVSRAQLIQLVRDGKVGVKDLSDAFTDLAEEARGVPDKAKGPYGELINQFVTLGERITAVAQTLLNVLSPAIQTILDQAIKALNVINRLLGAGALADAQRTLTGTAFKDFFTFGATPGTVNELADSLSRLTAKGLTSAEAINDLERVVGNFQGRVSSFQGKAGEESVRILQPQITRLRNEIAEARRGLDQSATQDPIGSIIPPFQAPPRGGGSSGGKARESQVPALERELQLKTQLFELQLKIDQASLAKDEELAIRLKGEQELARLAKQRLDILAEEIPLAEQYLKLEINTLAVIDAQRATSQQLDELRQKRQEGIDASVRGFNNQLALMQEEKQLAKDLLKIEQDLIDMKLRDPGITEAQVQQYRQAAQAVAYLTEEQRKYNEILTMVQGPVNAFVNGLTQGLQGIIDGTMSAEEAFAKMLRGMADALVQTAATMIAQYIAIGIAKAFAGMGGGGIPKTPTGQMSLGTKVGWNMGSGLAAMLADGGYVDRPTNAIVGEGGQPEYVIPESKMGSAMARWSAGTRGEAVINGQEAGGEFGDGNLAVASAPINITTGPVLRFNNEDYVTQEEFSRGVRRAAEQGEQRALTRLRTSPGQRRKIGL